MAEAVAGEWRGRRKPWLVRAACGLLKCQEADELFNPVVIVLSHPVTSHQDERQDPSQAGAGLRLPWAVPTRRPRRPLPDAALTRGFVMGVTDV